MLHRDLKIKESVKKFCANLHIKNLCHHFIGDTLDFFSQSLMLPFEANSLIPKIAPFYNILTQSVLWNFGVTVSVMFHIK